MSDKELWELMSIICEGQDSEQRRKVEQYITDLQKEIERLHSIIKEVREYMNKHEIEEVYLDCKLYETQVYKDILEILDKVGD